MKTNGLYPTCSLSQSSELLECLSEHLILHTYGLDDTRMPEKQLHHLLYLSKLLLAPSNINTASARSVSTTSHSTALIPPLTVEMSPLCIGWQISRK